MALEDDYETVVSTLANSEPSHENARALTLSCCLWSLSAHKDPFSGEERGRQAEVFDFISGHRKLSMCGQLDPAPVECSWTLG
jgi:hypothetical protein